MKMDRNNHYFKWGLTIFLVFCSCLVFLYLLFFGTKFKSALNTIYKIVMPIVFGCILAYLLTPTVNWLENKVLGPLIRKIKLKNKEKLTGLMRGISIFLTALLYYWIIQMLISMLLSQIIPSVQNLISNYNNYISNFMVWFEDIISEYPQVEVYVNEFIDRYSSDFMTFVNDTVLTTTSELIKTVSMSIINILDILWNFILGFIISIYLLASKEKFANQSKKVIYSIFQRDRANVIINNFRFAHKTFIGFVIGKVIDSIIIGCLCFIGTSILKTPYAALVSVIIGVTNVIPFFGPFLGAIPCSVLILVVDPMHPLNFVYFVIFILVLQQIDGNFIGPKILGDSTGLSSFWVIFSITLFGGILGIPGMIIGVPLFAIIYAAVNSHVSEALIRKQLSPKTENYTNVECIDEDGNVRRFTSFHEKNSKNFYSGSKFITSVDEWRYRYHKQLEEERAAEEKSGEAAEDADTENEVK